jgi:hypothetical protein
LQLGPDIQAVTIGTKKLADDRDRDYDDQLLAAAVAYGVERCRFGQRRPA